ncbi:hypothetical protein SAMN05444156_2195 [Verrucomicrobium sp. GAS474]|uniref:hypothetical protein n=1 Tax=Verrucomicrobium sp. GAS474 TaxID=1882831 RepID=UPI0008798EE2|nr:hypothetical protein [Verrucomicrobium sp. GAS474]SDU13997.1 hypothetical protein SAMN05444156_2195 [Verrucomicrobium sp. GAS474]
MKNIIISTLIAFGTIAVLSIGIPIALRAKKDMEKGEEPVKEAEENYYHPKGKVIVVP